MSVCQSVLSCVGEFNPRREVCVHCEMKEVCKTRVERPSVSVEVAVGSYLLSAKRCKDWQDRSSRFIRRFSRGVGVKRAITWGQLRRGLVLRKRREERQ